MPVQELGQKPVLIKQLISLTLIFNESMETVSFDFFRH